MSSRTTTCLFTACLLAAPAVASAQQGRPADRIAAMDRNGDGVVSRQEWTGRAEAFEERDWNDDGVLSGRELRPGARRGQARRQGASGATADEFDDWTVEGFAGLDRDRDRRLTLREWTHDRDSFDRADHNRDGVVTREEFLNEDGSARSGGGSASSEDRRRRSTPAYDAGYERGRVEGLQAGREDRERNRRWDLEGQRELETADSGYVSSVGTRADYQEGYRRGFRAAYAEGYNRR